MIPKLARGIVEICSFQFNDEKEFFSASVSKMSATLGKDQTTTAMEEEIELIDDVANEQVPTCFINDITP